MIPVFPDFKYMLMLPTLDILSGSRVELNNVFHSYKIICVTFLSFFFFLNLAVSELPYRQGKFIEK
jgi:hypothetical protein